MVVEKNRQAVLPPGVKKVGDILPEISLPVALSESDFTCPAHGAYRGVPMLCRSFDGREKIIAPDCPECFAEAEGKRRKEDAEMKAREKITRFKKMNIGKKFWDEDFSTFDAYTPELRSHLRSCRDFAANPDGKLVMIGENGNGKTHLAASILKETGGVMYTAYEINVNLRAAYNGYGSEREILAELCETPLLVIDEAEKVKDSQNKSYWMSHVINKRYNNLIPIIIIANCHTQAECKEKEKPCPKCLEYHLENDVISRIVEDGIMLNFSGDDYRYKKRTEGRKC
jgi:DNA replication protein DnaC